MEIVQKQTTEAIQEIIHNQAKERIIAKELCRLFFKNDDGNPFDLTDGQADIFNTILLRRFKRNEIITPTQYGKSEVLSMALDLRSITFHEPWTIIAGQQKKTDIIMGKAISHLFDHPSLERQIDPLSVPKMERLKHERSQERITWLDGGEIKALTASAQNRRRVKEVITGQGARNIVEDEASLIPDDLQAMIMRMLGGFPDSFLLKIGNPFYRNHFFRTWNSDRYHKIFIDYKQALAEGRFTEDFIDEMRSEPFFDVLYECKFPESDDLITNGFRKLILDKLLEDSFITEEQYRNDYCTVEKKDKDGNVIEKVPEGSAKIGVDVAGSGHDRSMYVIRYPKVMRILEENKISDTMQQVPIVENYMDRYNVSDDDTAIDIGGLGQGIGDRLYERERFVNKVMFGSSAPEGEKDRYLNMRAYMYYQLFQWLKNGGKIVRDDRFYELLVINYKENSEKKFQIQQKEELKKLMKDLGIEVTSPDTADAAALTFAEARIAVEDDDFEIT